MLNTLQKTNLQTLLLVTTAILLQSASALPCYGQRTKLLQHFWEVDPDFGDIWVSPTRETLLRFDPDSLNSTEVDERVRIARLICREHNNSQLDKARCLELLLGRLEKNDEPIQARRAILSAALLLDDGSHAEMLWKVAQHDVLLRSFVERALIGWKNPLAVETWRQRLKDPLARPTEVSSAIEGLGIVGGKSDTEQLQAILRGNATTDANRYLAAVALGKLSVDGLNDLAQQVLDSDLPQRFLIAANLLSQHTSERTQEQLRVIFSEGSNAAQFVAAQACVEHFPTTAAEFLPQMVAHADSDVRRLALSVLNTMPDEASTRLQGKFLSDRNVEIRRAAGSQLVKRAGGGQRGLVDEIVTEHMNAESWQGIEQAIIVTVGLQDRSRNPKLVGLLEHPRPEVNMHSGWAIMELVQDVATLASIEPHVQKGTALLAENGVNLPLARSDTIRLSFLFEAFGRNQFEPMESLLMKYVPKNGYKMGYPTRASAIWALGQLNKDKDNRALRKALEERIADLPPVLPEDPLVRFSCVLALGEMGYADSLPTINQFNEPKPSPMGYACDWAIEQINKSNAK